MTRSTNRLLLVGIGAILLAAATGVAFAAWVDNGDAMLMSMFEAGLAWCF